MRWNNVNIFHINFIFNDLENLSPWQLQITFTFYNRHLRRRVINIVRMHHLLSVLTFNKLLVIFFENLVESELWQELRIASSSARNVRTLPALTAATCYAHWISRVFSNWFALRRTVIIYFIAFLGSFIFIELMWWLSLKNLLKFLSSIWIILRIKVRGMRDLTLNVHSIAYRLLLLERLVWLGVVFICHCFLIHLGWLKTWLHDLISIRGNLFRFKNIITYVLPLDIAGLLLSLERSRNGFIALYSILLILRYCRRVLVVYMNITFSLAHSWVLICILVYLLDIIYFLAIY